MPVGPSRHLQIISHIISKLYIVHHDWTDHRSTSVKYNISHSVLYSRHETEVQSLERLTIVPNLLDTAKNRKLEVAGYI
jgi:hypothetical protein